MNVKSVKESIPYSIQYNIRGVSYQKGLLPTMKELYVKAYDPG